MILIIGRFQVQVEQLEAFQQFARDLIPEARKAAGCISFDLMQDLSQPDQFVMLEQWEDREALENNFSSETYQIADDAMSSFVVEDPLWEEYEV
ncbi:MAG: antibiotic biosynthesis monooxygenase [Anaerolineae bacterium]|nr:antibiotic biosynthesis monooxygenase [Anaerolineae bacterium]